MGKKLPRAHEPLSFTLIIDEERVRKIMTSPDLFSFPQERSGERKNSLSLIHQISSSSPEERKKERKSNFKACSPNEEAPGVFSSHRRAVGSACQHWWQSNRKHREQRLDSSPWMQEQFFEPTALMGEAFLERWFITEEVQDEVWTPPSQKGQLWSLTRTPPLTVVALKMTRCFWEWAAWCRSQGLDSSLPVLNC